MKILFLNLTLVLFTINTCLSQEQFNWNDIKKIELYSFDTEDYCSDINSENLDNQNSISCDKDDFKNFLIESSEPHFDVIAEPNCIILRISFSNATTDFFLLLNQGVLVDLNNYETMLQIKNNSEFSKLIEKYLE